MTRVQIRSCEFTTFRRDPSDRLTRFSQLTIEGSNNIAITSIILYSSIRLPQNRIFLRFETQETKQVFEEALTETTKTDVDAIGEKLGHCSKIVEQFELSSQILGHLSMN